MVLPIMWANTNALCSCAGGQQCVTCEQKIEKSMELAEQGAQEMQSLSAQQLMKAFFNPDAVIDGGKYLQSMKEYLFCRDPYVSHGDNAGCYQNECCECEGTGCDSGDACPVWGTGWNALAVMRAAERSTAIAYIPIAFRIEDLQTGDIMVWDDNIMPLNLPTDPCADRVPGAFKRGTGGGGGGTFTETLLTAFDSSTIDFTTSGTSLHTLLAEVKLSSKPGNAITVRPDGLYTGVISGPQGPAGPAGADGLVGPQGPAGPSGAAAFIHTQGTPLSTITVAHPYGRLPVVMVWDLATGSNLGCTMIATDNDVTFTFDVPTTFSAVFI